MANPNSRGQQRDKPFRDAIRMEAAALATGEVIAHPKGSWRAIAQAMLFKGSEGDVPAVKELGDRADGKVAQAIVGDDDADPIRLETIRRIIVKPGHSDSGSVPAATEPEPV